MKHLKTLILTLCLLATPHLSQADTVTDSVQPPKNISIDFFPPLISLSGSIGGEWLFYPKLGFGILGNVGFSSGENLISGLESDFFAYNLGITWHPGKKLTSGALYLRYFSMDMETELQDANKDIYRLKYVSQQIQAGYLSRDLFWKSLGYFWNLGIGTNVGETKTSWVGAAPPEDAHTLAKVVRVMSYLDIGAGLSWHL